LLIALIGHNSYLTLSYIKACHSINKQFSGDSFLDGEDHHWVFNTHSHPRYKSIYFLDTSKLEGRGFSGEIILDFDRGKMKLLYNKVWAYV